MLDYVVFDSFVSKSEMSTGACRSKLVGYLSTVSLVLTPCPRCRSIAVLVRFHSRDQQQKSICINHVHCMAVVHKFYSKLQILICDSLTVNNNEIW